MFNLSSFNFSIIDEFVFLLNVNFYVVFNLLVYTILNGITIDL